MTVGQNTAPHPWMSPDCTPGLVSVIIPTCNRETLVRETLESVAAQTYRPIEIIVVDDGSTDDTLGVVREFAERVRGDIEVRPFEQPHGGAEAARNRGLSESRGEFIQFLDSDDLLHADKLSAQAALLNQDARTEFVFSASQYFDGTNKAVHLPWLEDLATDRACILDHLLRKDIGRMLILNTDNVLYRRSLCARIGPRDTSILHMQETLYNVKALLLAEHYGYLPAVHAYIRVHRGQQMTDIADNAEGLINRRLMWNQVQELLRAAHWLDRPRRRLLAKMYCFLARGAFDKRLGQLGRDCLADGLAIAPPSRVRLKLHAVALLYRLLGVRTANAVFAGVRRVVHTLWRLTTGGRRA